MRTLETSTNSSHLGRFRIATFSRLMAILFVESKLYFSPIAVAGGNTKYAMKYAAGEFDMIAVAGAASETNTGSERQHAAPPITPIAGSSTRARDF